jgi:hypothetical protein
VGLCDDAAHTEAALDTLVGLCMCICIEYIGVVSVVSQYNFVYYCDTCYIQLDTLVGLCVCVYGMFMWCIGMMV